MKQYMEIGEKRNKLTLMEIVDKTKHYQFVGRFKCDCGNEKNIVIRNVHIGNIVSCGCVRREIHAKRLAEHKLAKTHGLTKHPLYLKWNTMKQRCDNPNHTMYLPNTSYAESWAKFETFYNWAIQYWFAGSVMYRIDDSLPFSESNVVFTKRKSFCNPEKFKETCLKKYGCESPLGNKDIREKIVKTNIEKYGPSGPLGNKEIQKKSRETSIRKYGTEYPNQSDIVKQKTKETNIARYGDVTYQSRPEVRQKTMQTNIEKYGTPFFFKTSGKEQSSVNDFLSEFGEFSPNGDILQGHEIDMFCIDRKFGVEYNGIRFHTEKHRRHKFYHMDKFLKCLKHEVNLVSVWSDDWQYKKEYVKNRIRWILAEESSPTEISVIDGSVLTDGLRISSKLYERGLLLNFEYDFTVKPNESTISEMIEILSGGKTCYYIAHNDWGVQRHTKDFDIDCFIDPDYTLVSSSSTRKRHEKTEHVKDPLRIWDCGQAIYSNERNS